MEPRWGIGWSILCSALCSAIAGAALAGCAHTAGAIAGEVAGEAAAEAPEPFVTETVKALGDPETQRAIAELFASPAVQDATRELIGGVTDGTLAALTDEARAARLAELSERFVARVSDAIADTLERDVGPALAQAMGRTIDATLREILDERTTEQIGAAVAVVARESTAALALAVREELGPAMRATLRDELIPAMAEALEAPETQAAIARTTRTLSREAVLGVQDAFEQIERRSGHPAQEETILTRLQGWAGEGFDFMQLALLVLLVILLVLVAWLVRSTARARAREAEAQAGQAETRGRDAAIVALTEAIRKSESPWSDDLLSLLSASFRDPEEAARLRAALERQRRRDGGEPPAGPLEPAGT